LKVQSSEIQTGIAILEGVDKNKDQSYFLALVPGAQLRRALFPIGHLTKPQVRQIALEAGLPNARKKDSQGICFIGEVRINDFLRHYIPDSPGEIVNTAGRVVGTHKGLHRYTLGQRRGIGVPSNTNDEHYVVVGKDAAANRLIVAFEGERTEGSSRRRCSSPTSIGSMKS
jgi:tRNA-specific 2-thiouridylase